MTDVRPLFAIANAGRFTLARETTRNGLGKAVTQDGRLRGGRSQTEAKADDLAVSEGTFRSRLGPHAEGIFKLERKLN